VLSPQLAQFFGGPLEQLSGQRYLAFHGLHLLANAAGGMVEHQVQIKKAGFQIAKRLPQIVNQAVEELFGIGNGQHIELEGQGSV
jgi:hypothetical protein